jgi:spermidine/putrescine transport system ATP-binding protein
LSDGELLRLEGIQKSFGQTEVLRGLDLSVGKGEFITLLGPSGCGKTTILRIIAGLETADSGRVFMDGTDVTALAPDLRGVNMVFQNYALFPHMNVERNVGYSLKLKGLSKTEIRQSVADALAMVQLSGFEKRRPHELSGGQRQRVAVARALINRPKVLLLDEPLGALDLQLRRQMQAELKRLQKQIGITFVYITHDQEEALAMSDRVAVMRNGLFDQVGSAAEVYKKPKTAFVAKFVGNANLIPVGDIVSVGDADSAGDADSVGDAGPDEYLAVREENIILTPAGPPADGVGEPPSSGSPGLPAGITGKTFAGGLLRITARLRNDKDGGRNETEICAGIQGIETPFAEGDNVLVSWLPQNAVTVKRNE